MLIINESNVTTIADLEGMTCSGRVFAPTPMQSINDEPLSKDKGIEIASNAQNPEFPKEAFSPKPAASQKEANELLRIIKKTDY